MFEKVDDTQDDTLDEYKIEKIIGYNQKGDDYNNTFNPPYCFEEETVTDIYQKYNTTRSRRYELVIYVSVRVTNSHIFKCTIQ